jgi:hypothetical protein
MSVRAVIGIGLFCAAIAAAIVGSVFAARMTREVNQKRQGGPVFGDVRTFAKSVQLFWEYRDLFPEGKLHIYALAFAGLMAACMLGAVVCALPG